MTEMNLSAKQTQIHRQIRPRGCQGGEGAKGEKVQEGLPRLPRGEKVQEGLMSSLGLADANYYLWTNKVYCAALYTALTVESEEEWKSLLIRMKEESENTGLKLNIKTMIIKIMACSPITSWKIEGEKVEAYDRFSFLGL